MEDRMFQKRSLIVGVLALFVISASSPAYAADEKDGGLFGKIKRGAKAIGEKAGITVSEDTKALNDDVKSVDSKLFGDNTPEATPTQTAKAETPKATKSESTNSKQEFIEFQTRLDSNTAWLKARDFFKRKTYVISGDQAMGQISGDYEADREKTTATVSLFADGNHQTTVQISVKQ